MNNLLGAPPADALLDKMSRAQFVTTETPPCFLWHTGEDSAVPLENSVAFATALRNHKIPFELHLYTQGGHGLGLGATFDWGADCVRWIRQTTQV